MNSQGMPIVSRYSVATVCPDDNRAALLLIVVRISLHQVLGTGGYYGMYETALINDCVIARLYRHNGA